MPDPAPVTDALGTLRARCEAAGCDLEVNENEGWRHLHIPCLPPRMDIGLYVVPTFSWPEFAEDLGIPAAHALLDWYERRDWVECESCYGTGILHFGLKMGDERYIVRDGDGAKCPGCGGLGRVPPGVGDEH